LLLTVLQRREKHACRVSGDEELHLQAYIFERGGHRNVIGIS
jgi:hypothetical protein